MLDLQDVLVQLASECEAAGMKISTSKSEAMVLDGKRVVCPLLVGAEVLPQVEEFMYPGVLFTSEERVEPVHLHLKESGHSFEDSQVRILAREDRWSSPDSRLLKDCADQLCGVFSLDSLLNNLKLLFQM
ncbi:hypothetical protein D4764_08G0008350 [Takifugu flavidus]|uniref:Reverse transcriptase domain-containing protein n=1 Tax=Takifugu flavidus TaxID=433684 RepID=A0A5C6MR73_9TELE|nr:hypothetical protein D4764_08G0008350 [Takifugu flavidus]